MKEIWSTITSKGQVTIPAEVRKQLGLTEGDRIVFAVISDGKVELRRPVYPNIDSLAGAAGSLKKPMPWKKVLQTAREERVRHIMERG